MFHLLKFDLKITFINKGVCRENFNSTNWIFINDSFLTNYKPDLRMICKKKKKKNYVYLF